MAAAPPRQHARENRHAVPDRQDPWYSVLGQAVAWTIAVVLFGFILILVIVPRLTGATPFTILTSSMVPLMPPGTVVVVHPEAFSDIHVGDVVTYQIQSGQPAVVTHRVIAINVEADGSVTLTTKGDANPTPDVNPVIPKQVRGVVWYWVPYVGYVGAFGSADVRSVVARAVGAALIAYAIYVLIASLVKRRRMRAPPE